MPIWFNITQARKHLLKHGLVYTLRPKQRRVGKDILCYEGVGKKGNVTISFAGHIINDIVLLKYVENSGFNSVMAWRLAAKDSKFLYKVKLISLEKNE